MPTVIKSSNLLSIIQIYTKAGYCIIQQINKLLDSLTAASPDEEMLIKNE